MRILLLALSIIIMTIPLLFFAWDNPPAYAFDRKDCLEDCRDWFEGDCYASRLWIDCMQECERKFWRRFDREFQDADDDLEKDWGK